MNNSPVPLGGNGHGIIPAADPVILTLSKDEASHLLAWSVDSRTKAVHESGHILTAVIGNPALPVLAVSIKGHDRGHSELGVTDDDQPVISLDTIIRRQITMALGGLAAELELLGEGSVGNQTDLIYATELAMKRIENGLEPAFPPISMSVWAFGTVPSALANLHARLIVAEMRRAKGEAVAIVHEHRDQVLAFASLLYHARRLEGAALDAALRSVGLEPAARERKEPS